MAIQGTPPPDDDGDKDDALDARGLTAREREVLALLADGLTNREIATKLFISPHTAERHVHNILNKMGAANRFQAGLRASLARRLVAVDSESKKIPGPTREGSPYPGLRPFAAEDADVYFGREETIARLLARIDADEQLTLVGASGSGKSSLLRAGLLPALKLGVLAGSDRWDYISISPGSDPLAELAARIASLNNVSPVSALHDLESDERTLGLVARHENDDNEERRLVVVIDQFEELFTMCHDQRVQRQFVHLLLNALSDARRKVIVIIAIRADFYGELASYPGFAELLEPGHVLLGEPTEEELRSSIEGPAEASGCTLESGLADRILADIRDAPGALPLLAHALRETWNNREGQALTFAGYHASGGIRGAIARTAEQLYGQLKPEEQVACQQLMLRLTSLGERTEATRRRVAFSELPESSTGRIDIRALISRFADARLVTTQSDWIEVAHEALIREWPRLRSWLDDDREGYRMLSHLTQSAQAWEHLGRDPGELYRGARLAAASEWAEEHGQSLNLLEKEFVAASLKLNEDERVRDARRLRRLRVLAAALAGFAFLAVIGTGVAFWQWNRANDQRNTAERATLEATLARLETEIPSTLKADRSLAFLLAREAYNLQPGPRTAELLNLVLADDPRYLGAIHPAESLVADYDVSLDGKFVALSTQSGAIELHDASTYSLLSRASGRPGLTQNTHLAFLSESLLAQAFIDPAGDAGVTVFAVPSLETVNEITWNKATEAFAGFDVGTSEVAVLNDPEGGGCCQQLRLIDPLTDAEHFITLPPLTFAKSPAGVTRNFVFDRDGRYVAAQTVEASGPPRIAVLDAKTLELVSVVSPIGETLTWYDLSRDGSTLVTAYSFGNLQTWDPATGEVLGAAKVNNFAPGKSSLSATSRLLVAASGNSGQTLLAVPDLQPVGSTFFIGGSAGSRAIFGANDESFFSFDGIQNEVDHWSVNGTGLASFVSLALGAGRAAVAPDGSWLVKQAPDGSWTRWSLPDFELLNRSRAEFGSTANNKFSLTPISPIVSADGRFIATANTDCKVGNQARCAGMVVIWDAATGLPVGSSIPVPNEASGGPGIVMAFHPGLPLLAVGGPPSSAAAGIDVEIWSLATGAPRMQSRFTVATERPNFLGMVFATQPGSTSTFLAIWAKDAAIQLWDVGSAEPHQLSVRQFGRQEFLAGNLQGWVVVGDGAEIKFFEPDQFTLGDQGGPMGALQDALPKNDGFFGHVSFDNEARFMALAQYGPAGSRISLWDLETSARIGAAFNWLPSATAGKSDDVFLSSDGARLTVANDNAVVVWDLDVPLWAEKTCEAAGRNLTESEWTKYFPGRDYEATCPQWPPRPNL